MAAETSMNLPRLIDAHADFPRLNRLERWGNMASIPTAETIAAGVVAPIRDLHPYKKEPS
jgi:hypothetical protein